MKTDHQKLITAYIAKIDQICDDCEDKSHFDITDIVSVIAALIESGQFYLPARKTPVLELCDKWKKLSPEWSTETNNFVNELYSRLEHAETELEVFNLRLQKQWTTGSNLYTQKEVDALEDQSYNAGYQDAEDAGSLHHDLGFRPQD